MIQKNIVICLFIFYGQFLFAQHNESPKIDSLEKTEVLKSICNSLSNYYVFPDKAKVMFDFLKQQNEGNIFSSITNPNQFANEIQKILRSVSKDNHLRIEYNPRLEKDILKFLADKKVRRKF